MKKRTIKRTLLWSVSLFTFLVLVLAVHIYVVTRPKVISPYSKTMVRIDLHQPIDQAQADNMRFWFNRQKGVVDSYVSVKSDKALFLFFTTQNTGNKVVADFKTQFHFDNAQRFLPAASDYEKSCPVAGVSEITKFFQHIL